MGLEEFREKLDIIDQDLVDKLSERMAVIPLVAEYKKTNGVSRYHPEREEEIIQTKRSLAERHGISPDMVEAIYREIFKESHRIEKEIMGE